MPCETISVPVLALRNQTFIVIPIQGIVLAARKQNSDINSSVRSKDTKYQLKANKEKQQKSILNG